MPEIPFFSGFSRFIRGESFEEKSMRLRAQKYRAAQQKFNQTHGQSIREISTQDNLGQISPESSYNPMIEALGAVGNELEGVQGAIQDLTNVQRGDNIEDRIHDIAQDWDEHQNDYHN